jgi:hypothetical protein
MSKLTEAPDISFVPAQFPSIQAAVDAARGATTIMIQPGYYNESVVVKDKECIVVVSTSQSRRGVAITGSTGTNVFLIEDSTVHLSGIAIRSDGRLRGISVTDSTLSLQECVIACNRASRQASSGPVGAGMACWNSSVRIQKTPVIGNMVESVDGHVTDALGGGLYFDTCRVEIAGSTIQANAAYSRAAARGGGIWCSCTRMRMWRSRVTDNILQAAVSEGGAIYFKDSARSDSGSDSTYLKEVLRCELGGSVITGNGFPEGKGGGIFIEGDPAAVSIHRNTAVKLNHPDDVHPAR